MGDLSQEYAVKSLSLWEGARLWRERLFFTIKENIRILSFREEMRMLKNKKLRR